jgi:MYXO-CTERM domain-containing protein
MTWWLGLGPLASAATLTVGGGGYSSIGDAVGDANDGDVIEVSPGTYDETVAVDVDVTIVATGGPNNTVWGSDWGDDSLDVEGADVVVEGIRFAPDGRAVDVHDGSVTLVAVEIRDREVWDRVGAAVRARSGTTVVIEDSELANNDATFWSGGHVYAENATVTLRRTLLVGGSGNDGGCVWAADTTLVLEDSTVEGCEGQQGAGIYLDGGTLTATDTLFVGSATPTGFGTDPDGGALLARDATVTLTDCIVDDNRGGGTGGGMRLEESTTTLVRTEVTGNQADFGGGLYVDGGSLELVDSYLADNVAADAGGAVRWRHEGGLLSVSGSQLDRNVAGTSGGAIGTLSRGGALGELVIEGSHFAANEATEGGALALSEHATVSVADNQLCYNHAVDGGGALLDGTGGLWLGNDFVGNRADGLGGGLALIGAVDALVGANDFLANEAAEGGGLYTADSSVIFVNNLVAWQTGHGVWAQTTTGTLTYSLFHDNSPDHLSPGLAKNAGPGLVYADPMLTAFSDDGDCSNDDLTPLPGSPLVDAGDPSLLDDDGSISDIGSVQGEGVPGEDLDGDGVASPADCDDTDASVFPGAEEDCTDVDRDCSGDPYDAEGTTTYYLDADDDGFGNELESTESCAPPDGYVLDATDCRDDDATVFPGAPEVCNGLDDDCDALIDENLVTSWWPDGDGDGWGAGLAINQCDAPSGYADRDGDCDDTDASVHPTADDIDGDGIDSDCDGTDGPAPTTGDGAPVTPVEGEKLEATGSCGCSTPPSSAGAWVGVLALLGWRRRRLS